MSQMDMKKAAGFLLAGAVVGAGVALLCAPQSGAQTKRDIRRLARNTVDRLDDLQTDIRDQVSGWVNDIAETVKDGADRGRKLSAEGYAKVLHVFDSAKNSVDDGKLRMETMINKEDV
jgi:gas vesicle protein